MGKMAWNRMAGRVRRQLAFRSLRGRWPAAVLLCIAWGGWFASRPSHAADSSIAVKAEIYKEACQVSAGSDLQIDFGTLLVAALQAAGTSSPWVNAPKSIELACPDGIGSVATRFDGSADGVAVNTFRNDGSAKNVSIELQLQSGAMLAPGVVQNVTVVAGKAEYALRARLYAHRGGATVGTVAATASFTLSYP